MRRTLIALVLLIAATLTLTVTVGATAAYLTQTMRADVGTLSVPSFGATLPDGPIVITLTPGAWQMPTVAVENGNATPTTYAVRIRLGDTKEQRDALRSHTALDSIVGHCSVRTWADFEDSYTVAGRVGPGYRYPSEPWILNPGGSETTEFYFANTSDASTANPLMQQGFELPFTLELVSAEPVNGGGALWDAPRTDHCQSDFEVGDQLVPGRIALRSIDGVFIVPPAAG